MLKGESHWVGWGRARWVPGMSVGYGWSVAGCETYCRDPIGQRYVIALESYLSVMCSIVMCLVLPRFVLFGYLWLSPLKQVNNSRTRSVTLICYLLNQPAIPRPANYTLVKISRLVGKISTSTPYFSYIPWKIVTTTFVDLSSWCQVESNALNFTCTTWTVPSRIVLHQSVLCWYQFEA